MKIPESIDQKLESDEYFENMINRDKDFPVLQPLEKPCHDCAVTCGFYLPLSEELKTKSKLIQKKVSEKWYCHNNSKKACRGNWNYIFKGKS